MGTFKDSGQRAQYNSGAVRDVTLGKGRFDLIPVDALWELARVFEIGSKKYAARNWEKGIPLSRFMDSGLRHTFRYLRGDRDEPHLAMAVWNFTCLLQTAEWIRQGKLPDELNDLPHDIHTTGWEDILENLQQSAPPQRQSDGSDRLRDDGARSEYE